MANWTDIRSVFTHNFTFKSLVNPQVILQRNGSQLRYTDADEITHVYKLRSFPTLATEGIEVVFDIEQYTKSGKQIPLAKGPEITEYVYTEPESMIDNFAGYSPPQGVGAFGLQQAINGLTRRLAVFEGHPQLQTGHRIFDFLGSAVQPVTFELINIIHETQVEDVENPGTYIPQGDGSFTIDAIDGTAPFEYFIADGAWLMANPPGATGYDTSAETYTSFTDPVTITDMSAGTYLIFVKDSTGEAHQKQLVVSLEQIEPVI
jgi:hypothetical protein